MDKHIITQKKRQRLQIAVNIAQLDQEIQFEKDAIRVLEWELKEAKRYDTNQ